jgi:hypothetical protein
VENLASHIPLIKRARDFRLYDIGGRRFVDLYRNHGRLLFGHKPPLLVNTLKQILEKGLLADLPSVYTKRLTKALANLFPDYKTILVTPSQSRLEAWLSEYLGKEIQLSDVTDPLLPEKGTINEISLWRPFFSGNTASEAIIPLLPFGFGNTLSILCIKGLFTPTDVPELVSPFILAGAIHALHLLAKTTLPEWYGTNLFGTMPYFRQKDIYLVSQCTKETYARVFLHFLQNGFLLSPHYPEPSVLPFELSSGELKKLIVLFTATIKGDDHD